jgi:hypothetical protein
MVRVIGRYGESSIELLIPESVKYKNYLDKNQNILLKEGSDSYQEIVSRLDNYAKTIAQVCHETPPETIKRLNEKKARFSIGYPGIPSNPPPALLPPDLLGKLTENFSISGSFEADGEHYKMTVEIFSEPVFYEPKNGK